MEQNRKQNSSQSDRYVSVSLGPYMSDTAGLSCGVSQGSVLRPILFGQHIRPSNNVIGNFKGIPLLC